MQSNLKKVALITGANKGIGFEAARQLGKAGCTVLLGARHAELGEAAAAKLRADDLDVRFIELDVTNPDTIQTAATKIEQGFGRLDILINNAGIALIGEDGPPSTANLLAVHQTMETNFLGALAVAQAMLPLVRKSAAGRIVNVTSDLGSLAKNGDLSWAHVSVKAIGYAASKAAMNMLTVQLAYELRDAGIKVNSANPGYTATDLNGHRGYQTVEEGTAETVRLALIGEGGPSGGYFESSGPLPW